MQGGVKKSRFSTNISLYLGNDARKERDIVTMEGDIGNMTWVRLDRGYELTWYELTLGTS